jgi:hypothetical protein
MNSSSYALNQSLPEIRDDRLAVSCRPLFLMPCPQQDGTNIATSITA